MARLSRIALPDVPHHVTRRGNQRLPIFLSGDDRLEYLSLIAPSAEATQTRCLAWCLMQARSLKSSPEAQGAKDRLEVAPHPCI